MWRRKEGGGTGRNRVNMRPCVGEFRCCDRAEYDVSTVQNDAMLASMESAASSMSEAQKQAYQAQFGNRTHHAAVTAEDDESAVVTVVSDPGVPGRGFTFELVYEGGKWRIESIAFQ